MPQTTSIADYQVLLDGNKIIAETIKDTADIHKEITLWFTSPTDLVETGFSRQPILAFKVLTFEDSKFTIFLNSREIISTSLGANQLLIYWEVFSFQTAFPEKSGGPNPAPLRFLVDEGRLRISDMILWYQVNKP